jgi:hypothetical protein
MPVNREGAGRAEARCYRVPRSKCQASDALKPRVHVFEAGGKSLCAAPADRGARRRGREPHCALTASAFGCCQAACGPYAMTRRWLVCSRVVYVKLWAPIGKDEDQPTGMRRPQTTTDRVRSADVQRPATCTRQSVPATRQCLPRAGRRRVRAERAFNHIEFRDSLRPRAGIAPSTRQWLAQCAGQAKRFIRPGMPAHPAASLVQSRMPARGSYA